MKTRMKVGRCCCVGGPIAPQGFTLHGFNDYDRNTLAFFGPFFHHLPAFSAGAAGNFLSEIYMEIRNSGSTESNRLFWIALPTMPTTAVSRAEIVFETNLRGGEGLFYTDWDFIFGADPSPHWLFGDPSGGTISLTVECERDNSLPRLTVAATATDADPFAVGYANTGSQLPFTLDFPSLEHISIIGDPDVDIDLTGELRFDVTAIVNQHVSIFGGGAGRFIFNPVSPIPPGAGAFDVMWGLLTAIGAGTNGVLTRLELTA